MRCRRAQMLIPAAADGEVGGRRRRALDRHVARCAACRREQVITQKMLAALAALPTEAAISARLEQATVRQVRLLAAEVGERVPHVDWWRRLSIPALAVAAAAVVAVVVQRAGEMPPGPAAVPGVRAAARTRRGATEQVASAPKRPAHIARTMPGALVSEPPAEPPPALAAAPELFVNLPILRHLEKLEHFEAIQTTTLDDEPATPGGDEGRSNG